jgi:hypothetical protein
VGLRREIQEANDDEMKERAARAEDADIIAEYTGDDSDFHGFGHGHREKELTPQEEREMQNKLQIAKLRRCQE